MLGDKDRALMCIKACLRVGLQHIEVPKFAEEIRLTDWECEELAKITVFHFTAIRNAFLVKKERAKQ